jgi:hypothetical protein
MYAVVPPVRRIVSRMKKDVRSPQEEIVERRVAPRVPLRVLQVRGESRKAFFFGTR